MRARRWICETNIIRVTKKGNEKDIKVKSIFVSSKSISPIAGIQKA